MHNCHSILLFFWHWLSRYLVSVTWRTWLVRLCAEFAKKALAWPSMVCFSSLPISIPCIHKRGKYGNDIPFPSYLQRNKMQWQYLLYTLFKILFYISWLTYCSIIIEACVERSLGEVVNWNIPPLSFIQLSPKQKKDITSELQFIDVETSILKWKTNYKMLSALSWFYGLGWPI